MSQCSNHIGHWHQPLRSRVSAMSNDECSMTMKRDGVLAPRGWAKMGGDRALIARQWVLRGLAP